MKYPKENSEMDNIIRVSSMKGLEIFLRSLIERGTPEIYNKYGETLVFRFTGNLIQSIYQICSRMKWWGLEPIKCELSKEKIEVGKNIAIHKAFEITCNKIGALRATQDEAVEFEERFEKLWENMINNCPEIKPFWHQ